MSGWCPFAERCASPNYTQGNAGRKAVVLHIAEGGYAGSLRWLRDPASEVSAHFLIARTGDIAQLVSVDDTAWTNGLTPLPGGRWLTPTRKPIRPRWPLVTPGVNPNRETITIEREGLHGDVPTPALDAATVRLLRWLVATTGLVLMPGRTLIGHADINHLDKRDCPGPHTDFAALAAAVHGQRWVVAVPAGARIRRRPSTSAAILGALDPGAEVIGRVVAGDGGEWVQRSTVGYVKRSLLQPV